MRLGSILLVAMLLATVLPSRPLFAESDEARLCSDIHAMLTARSGDFPAAVSKALEHWRGAADRVEELSAKLPIVFRAAAKGLAAQLRYPDEFEQFRRGVVERLRLIADPPQVGVTAAGDPIPGFEFDCSFGYSLDSGKADWEESRARARFDFKIKEAEYYLSLYLPDTPVTEAFLDEMLVCPAIVGEIPKEVVRRVGESDAPGYVATRALGPLWQIAYHEKKPLPVDLAFEAAVRCGWINSPVVLVNLLYIFREATPLVPLLADRADVIIPRMPIPGETRNGEKPVFVRFSERFSYDWSPPRWVKEHPEEAAEYRKKADEMTKEGIQKPWVLYPGEVFPPSPSPSPTPRVTPIASLTPSSAPSAVSSPLNWLIPAISLAAALLAVIAIVLWRRRRR